MPTISLCMITKNNAKTIKRCLRSIRNHVDEIIVVDMESSDDTPLFAKQLGAKVYEIPWEDNKSAARNASIEKATGEWILFLDADEELAPGSGDKLREISKDPDVTGYFLKVINYILEENWYETCPDLAFRFFKNKGEHRFHGAVRERISDVILKQNPNAVLNTCEEVIIFRYDDNQDEDPIQKQINLEILEQELEQDPQDALLRYYYGEELFSDDEYEAAVRQLIIALDGIDPKGYIYPKLLRYIIIAYFNVELYEEAEGYCKLAIGLFPDYADIYYFRGLICYMQNEYGDAFYNFKKAIATPEQPTYYSSFDGMRGFRALFYCGKVAEEFLNYDEALNYYLLALEDNTFCLTPLEEIIRLLNPKKSPDATREYLDKIILFENNQAFQALGWICYEQGAYNLALEYLSLAGESADKDPEIKLMKAVCYIQLGHMLPALSLLKNFPKTHNLYPAALFNLFFYYWLRGNKQRLRETLEKILDLGVTRDTATVLYLFKGILYRKNIKTPIELKPTSSVLFLDFFKRVLDAGYIEKASMLLEKLSGQTIDELSYELGKLYFEFGCHTEAHNLLSRALKNSPKSTHIMYEMAVNYERLNEKGKAADMLGKIIALEHPAPPKVYIKIIKLHQEIIKEIFKEAISYYPDVIEIKKLNPT